MNQSVNSVTNHPTMTPNLIEKDKRDVPQVDGVYFAILLGQINTDDVTGFEG